MNTCLKLQEKPQEGRLPLFLKDRDKLNWKVPSLFSNDEIMFGFIETCNDFGIKLPIRQVFGSVKNSWNGGRESKIRNFDKNHISTIIKKYNENNIGCSFTFTNYHITRNMLDDSVGNELLKIASDYGDNYAIVSSELLAEYIRDNYPKIKLESSILKPTYECPGYTETPKYYDNLCERYDKVMLRPEIAQDLRFLKKIKNKDKLDIIVNSCCVYKCPFSIRHYDRTAAMENELIPNNNFMCNERLISPISLHYNNFLSNKEIDKLISLGFNNFKLNGRNVSSILLMHIIGTYIFDCSGVFQFLLNYMFLKKLKTK